MLVAAATAAVVVVVVVSWTKTFVLESFIILENMRNLKT